MPKTPGRSVSNVTASAFRRRCFVASTPVRARPDPGQLGPLADREQDPVAGDRELRPGRGLRAAPAGRVGLAGRIRMNSPPVTLPFASVMTRVGPAWKIALDAFLDRLVDLVRGRHVLHVAAVDERHLGGALADRRPRAVHRGEAAADDDDALAGVARVRQAERRGPEVLEAVEDLVGVLARHAELVRVVAADRDDDRVEALVLEVVEPEVAAEALRCRPSCPPSRVTDSYSASRTSTFGRRYCGIP